MTASHTLLRQAEQVFYVLRFEPVTEHLGCLIAAARPEWRFQLGDVESTDALVAAA